MQKLTNRLPQQRHNIRRIQRSQSSNMLDRHLAIHKHLVIRSDKQIPNTIILIYDCIS